MDCRVILNDFFKERNELQLLYEACGDGSRSNIYKCGSNKCLFQDKFQPCDKIVSTTTLRMYNCIVPEGSLDLDCHSSNVVYLITCLGCGMQYVGETCQQLNARFNWHNTCFRHPEKYAFCKILNNHFREGLCKEEKYSVRILEKLPGSGRTEENVMDMDSKPLRKARELHWMLKLRTIYPYGLNDRIGDEFKQECDFQPIGTDSHHYRENL